MFGCLATRYDLLNSLLSLGLHHCWRRRAVGCLAPRDGGRYLDIGCGTGDVALEILRRTAGCRVTGLDPSPEMLAVAAEKARRAGVAERLELVRADACAMPFADGVFDGIASAFALRSFDDRARAFAEMRRVLRPGGCVALLELTVPRRTLPKIGYWLHARLLGALFARLVCGTAGPYRFLLRSVDQFPAAAITGELRAAGFERSRAEPIACGVATVFVCSAGLSSIVRGTP